MTTAPPDGFAVRRMAADELDLIRRWAAAEGWNPGRHDGPCFHAADPAGFFVGELDGEPVACVSCVAYDDRFGFLGQYIVRPDHRGRGYGLRTWRAGLAHLGGRNVGLDGVLDQQANYAKEGFRFAHQHVRYAGEAAGDTVPAGLVRLSAVPAADVLAYDRRCFPAPRPAFLAGWLALPESVALGSLREGALVGYGVIRRSETGHKVGPLFADDPPTAAALLAGLTAAVGGSFCVDLPDDTFNPAAGGLVGRFGLREQFRTARMYTQGPPAVDRHRVFGITTMELG